jgi:hypothetical protein
VRRRKERQGQETKKKVRPPRNEEPESKKIIREKSECDQKHPDGITSEIQKELKIVYRVDGYPKEFEGRKLIKSKKEGIERTYFPL